jgi:esterase/lipase superfamily enzyme
MRSENANFVDLRACVATESDSQRLDCYDHATGWVKMPTAEKGNVEKQVELYPFPPSAGRAGDTSGNADLRACVAIESNSQRLACYDHATGRVEMPTAARDVEHEVELNSFPPPARQAGDTSGNYAVERVYFATDRNRTSSSRFNDMFGGLRGTSISYGSCDVSIPRDHRMGEMESPSIWRLEFRENPDRHVVLLRVRFSNPDQFFRDIEQQVHGSRGKNAFVFVHGYNVTFADAARRTAQMAYDLGFDGVPVFYSWPSRGDMAKYTVDEQSIEWSEANIKAFLSDFFTRSDAKNIYLIGHSMGNRGLTRALASLMSEKPELRNRLKELILAAPDIDAEVFVRDIAPALAKARLPTTLYASSTDRALLASRVVHGLDRAGYAGQHLIVFPGIETIDATNVDTSLLGHSYFGDNRALISDLYYLIRDGTPADSRFGLRRASTSAGTYWIFRQ